MHEPLTDEGTTGAWPDEWEQVADVVVVGSGMAGLSAAITAASRGADVIVLERAAEPGGTTAKSAATMWLPNNPVMRGLGLDDPRDEALQYMVRVGHPTRYDPQSPTLGVTENEFSLLERFFDTAGDAFSQLRDLGSLDIDESATTRYPDYHADLEEDAAPIGRSLRVRLPEGHDPAVDPTGGQLAIDRMLAVAKRLGVRFTYGVRVVDLVRTDSGAVIGVVSHLGRRTVLVGARQGVVFASGGFLQNPTLRTQFLRGHVFGGGAVETSTGDLVDIAGKIGARLGNMTHAWWDQVVLENVLNVPSTVRDVYSPFGDSMIMVNRFGVRTMNEKMPYSERGPVHFNWDVTRREYPNHLMFMVYDDAVASEPAGSRFRYPVPPPGEEAAYVISGDTLEDLTHALSDRLQQVRHETGGLTLDDGFSGNLQATIERFDGFAHAGVDEDFKRGESPIERAWASTSRNPSNPTMHPFASTGPYHCIILGAGALDTKGGPVINDRAQIVDVDGSPIPGLYGAGNCIASPAGAGYFGPGATIGLAMTFGYIAGCVVAEEPLRTP